MTEDAERSEDGPPEDLGELRDEINDHYPEEKSEEGEQHGEDTDPGELEDFRAEIPERYPSEDESG